jgi:phenylpyruvate tautomerase PptA (4-oxalocrotonate tautomerase family)
MELAHRLTNATYKITNDYPSKVFIATDWRVVRSLRP